MAWTTSTYEAVVDMHLPGGFTKVRVHTGGGLYFDVRTDSIPAHLRTMGSRVLIKIGESIAVEDLPAR